MLKISALAASSFLVVPIVLEKVPSEFNTLYSLGAASPVSLIFFTKFNNSFLLSLFSSIAFFASSYKDFEMAILTFLTPSIFELSFSTEP